MNMLDQLAIFSDEVLVEEVERRKLAVSKKFAENYIGTRPLKDLKQFVEFFDGLKELMKTTGVYISADSDSMYLDLFDDERFEMGLVVDEDDSEPQQVMLGFSSPRRT